MKADQVDAALHQKFVTDDQRLVFWHDEDGEFAEYVSAALPDSLAGVQVLDVAVVGGLAAKIQLERTDPDGKYLIYSHGNRPSAAEDWLFDIRLYSTEFHADIASIWLEELGLSRLSLRDYVKSREAFLRSQERRRKLRALLVMTDEEADIDSKMMCVLIGSDIASPFAILRGVCHQHSHGRGRDGSFDLKQVPEVIDTFQKMNLLDRFWEQMQQTFGYASQPPSVAGLLRSLFVSELFKYVKDDRLPSLTHHRLPGGGSRNAVVFLTQWRDSAGKAASYDAVAFAIAEEQRIDSALSTLDLEELKGIFTFWDAEKRVVSLLKEQVLEERHTVNVESVALVATERRAGHWLSGPGSDSPERLAVTDAYEAITAAAELYALTATAKGTLTFDRPSELLASYTGTLYRVDQLYRRFRCMAKRALGMGWDLLKELASDVERVYDQAYLQPLGIEWSRLLDSGFLDSWKDEELPAQQSFFETFLRPHLSAGERNRAFVIISDAFRYEAAQELSESLRGVYRMESDLSAMLGVVPSYTALGMASLLPHETIAYTDKGVVLVDGQSVATTVERGNRLALVDGMACQAKDLREMKRDDAREFTQGSRVVYIYHNVIDVRGESSDLETFDAVETCISELADLVQFCVNTLNAGKVWVTADHGFLFQFESPAEPDRSKLDYKPDGTLKFNNRYLIGRNLGTPPSAHSGAISVTAGIEDDMQFWVPRSTNRFHFGGGARFVHGGAMPQEVVVPVLTITHLRGEKKERSRTKKVSVQVLGVSHKITTPRHRFEIIQTEAVSDRRNPITLRAAVYDGPNAVTSIETITFDSASNSMEDWKKEIRLELRTGTFDKHKPYRLVLRDAENDAEVQAVPVVIDRSFDDDF